MRSCCVTIILSNAWKYLFDVGGWHCLCRNSVHIFKIYNAFHLIVLQINAYILDNAVQMQLKFRSFDVQYVKMFLYVCWIEIGFLLRSIIQICNIPWLWMLKVPCITKKSLVDFDLSQLSSACSLSSVDLLKELFHKLHTFVRLRSSSFVFFLLIISPLSITMNNRDGLNVEHWSTLMIKPFRLHLFVSAACLATLFILVAQQVGNTPLAFWQDTILRSSFCWKDVKLWFHTLYSVVWTSKNSFYMYNVNVCTIPRCMMLCLI